MRRVLLILSVLAAVLLGSTGSAQAVTPLSYGCSVDAGTFYSQTSHHYKAIDASFPGMACPDSALQMQIHAWVFLWDGKTWTQGHTVYRQGVSGDVPPGTPPYVWPTRIYATGYCNFVGQHARVLVQYTVHKFNVGTSTAAYWTNYSVCS